MDQLGNINSNTAIDNMNYILNAPIRLLKKEALVFAATSFSSIPMSAERIRFTSSVAVSPLCRF